MTGSGKSESSPQGEVSSDEQKQSNTAIFMRREISMFESFILFCIVMGSLELGPTSTTILIYLLATIAYGELVNLQSRTDKEEIIQIKSKWTDWLFFWSFQYFFTFRAWCSYGLLYDSFGESAMA